MGGAALVDLDDDGDLDAYLVQSGSIAAERASRRCAATALSDVITAPTRASLFISHDTNEWMDGRMGGRMDTGMMDGWMDRWMDGRTDGRMDGQADGGTDEHMALSRVIRPEICDLVYHL